MKTSTIVYVVAAIVLYCMLTKKKTAGKQAVQMSVDEQILVAQGAMVPLDYPNTFGDVGAYNGAN